MGNHDKEIVASVELTKGEKESVVGGGGGGVAVRERALTGFTSLPPRLTPASTINGCPSKT